MNDQMTIADMRTAINGEAERLRILIAALRADRNGINDDIRIAVRDLKEAERLERALKGRTKT